MIGNDRIEVTSLEYHSKRITPNALFVAITGFQQDGNAWVEEAVARGASAVVTERPSERSVPQVVVSNARAALADLAVIFCGYDPAVMRVFGVTGTNGKTTSCFLIRKILEAQGTSAGIITSLVYDTGANQIPAVRTTPESLDIFRMLQEMRRNGCRQAVIEISSHALVLHRVRNLKVDVALFTNISRDHLDFHADMNDYLSAKAKLLDMTAGPTKWAVINSDCPEFESLFGRARCLTMSYGIENGDADVHLKDCRLSPSGSRFELCTPQGSHRVSMALTGRYNLYNALGAAAAATAAGVSLNAIVAGLEASSVVPGRLERVDSKAPFTVFIDYAHTPDALTRTIATLREIGSGKILTLFGCGGDRDRGKRPLMGRAVTDVSDYAVLTTDNPRTEDPAQILEDVKPGIVPGAQVDVILDRREAINHILSRAQAGDIVLLAGKGAENYQEVHGVRHPFSDKDIAIENLRQLGYDT